MRLKKKQENKQNKTKLMPVSEIYHGMKIFTLVAP